MNKKKIILIAVAVVAVAGISIRLFGGSTAKHKVTYETATVIKGEISESITATGTIEPVTEVEVGTQVSGIIDKIYADYNSVVTKGQLIAEMDRVTLQSEVASQRAAYNGAKAEYEYQRKNYERNRGLHEKQLISDTDYEQSVYNYEKAKSSYESSQASLAKAERNLSYATITSPIDGVVINRAVEEGQTVASGFETPTLFTIAADLTQMQVVADVDEADIGGVKDGQRVTFSVDAYPNDTFEGVVTQIRLGRGQLYKFRQQRHIRYGRHLRSCHIRSQPRPETETAPDGQRHDLHTRPQECAFRSGTCAPFHTRKAAYRRE